VEKYGEGEFHSEHEKRFEEAELLYKRALTIRIQVLGPSHPSVDSCLKRLVELYKAQGNYTEIEQLYQEVVRTYEQILGPDHPTTISAQSTYTRFLREAKRKQETI
jgi:DNA-binding SARP family transcriptional activator